MAGEEPGDIGRDGLQRARIWLSLSTRIRRTWAYDDETLGDLLQFRWPCPQGRERSFSFDMGGNFQGAPFDGQSFLAEVKKYKRESNLPALFRDFLAKCYVALGERPMLCQNFLWISWAPFQASKWDEHATTENVRRSVIHEINRKRVLGVDNEADAALKLDADPERIVKVASRIWLITLSDRQEELVLTEDHYSEVMKLILKERGPVL